MTLYPIDCPGLVDLRGILVSSASLHSINQTLFLAQTVGETPPEKESSLGPGSGHVASEASGRGLY